MKTPTVSDIIIIGGGPTGLLLASKLVPFLDTCIIDQAKILVTEKFWISTADRISAQSLDACVCHSLGRATLGSFLGSGSAAVGSFAVIDETQLIRELRRRCEARGAKIYTNTRLLGVAMHLDHISILTTQGNFLARLLIDASGGFSPIASTFGLHRLDGFYSIYGQHLSGIELNTRNIIGAHVIHLGHPIPILEVVPTGSSSAFVVIFIASKKLVTPETLRDRYRDHLQYNPFFSCTEFTKSLGSKMGIIPIGSFRDRKIPGIISFGEAAMLQSPLLGTAFNDALEYCDTAAQQILASFKHADQGPSSTVNRPSRKADPLFSVVCGDRSFGKLQSWCQPCVVSDCN